MSPRELLASLPEGATPGPWRFDSHPPAMILAAGDPGCVGTFPMNHGRFTTLRPNDAALIAAAPLLRDALRETLAENERLRELLDEARYAVGDVQMSGEDLHDLELRIEAALVASVSE